MSRTGAHTPPILGLILAAGGSTRMGRPKALLHHGGRPLIAGHVAALSTVCASVRAVLGGHGAAIDAALPPEVRRIWNPDWERTGMSDSLALGLADLDAEAMVLMTPVDLPPAPEAVLRALIAAGAPAVPTWSGRTGHPVLLVAGPTRVALRTSPLDQALAEARRVEVDWAETLANLNTPADWEALRRG